jgi:hypothetical protein
MAKKRVKEDGPFPYPPPTGGAGTASGSAPPMMEARTSRKRVKENEGISPLGGPSNALKPKMMESRMPNLYESEVAKHMKTFAENLHEACTGRTLEEAGHVTDFLKKAGHAVAGAHRGTVGTAIKAGVGKALKHPAVHRAAIGGAIGGAAGTGVGLARGKGIKSALKHGAVGAVGGAAIGAAAPKIGSAAKSAYGKTKEDVKSVLGGAKGATRSASGRKHHGGVMPAPRVRPAPRVKPAGPVR